MYNLIFLIISAIGYLAAALNFQHLLFSRSRKSWTGGQHIIITAVIFHTIALIIRTFESKHLPFAGLAESLSFYSWMIAVLYIIIAPRWKIEVIGAFAAPFSFILLFASLFSSWEIAPLNPALQSYWFGIHATIAFLGYSAFTLATCSAILYFIQSKLLKEKHLSGIFQKIPSLEVLDRACYKLVILGFPLIAMGIVTGAFWAQNAWGSYWNWDPKETASLVTALFYATYIHARIVAGWQGKKVNLLLIIAFICMLFTYLGVGFVQSQHKY